MEPAGRSARYGETVTPRAVAVATPGGARGVAGRRSSSSGGTGDATATATAAASNVSESVVATAVAAAQMAPVDAMELGSSSTHEATTGFDRRGAQLPSFVPAAMVVGNQGDVPPMPDETAAAAMDLETEDVAERVCEARHRAALQKLLGASVQDRAFCAARLAMLPLPPLKSRASFVHHQDACAALRFAPVAYAKLLRALAAQGVAAPGGVSVELADGVVQEAVAVLCQRRQRSFVDGMKAIELVAPYVSDTTAFSNWASLVAIAARDWYGCKQGCACPECGDPYAARYGWKAEITQRSAASAAKVLVQWVSKIPEANVTAAWDSMCDARSRLHNRQVLGELATRLPSDKIDALIFGKEKGSLQADLHWASEFEREPTAKLFDAVLPSIADGRIPVPEHAKDWATTYWERLSHAANDGSWSKDPCYAALVSLIPHLPRDEVSGLCAKVYRRLNGYPARKHKWASELKEQFAAHITPKDVNALWNLLAIERTVGTLQSLVPRLPRTGLVRAWEQLCELGLDEIPREETQEAQRALAARLDEGEARAIFAQTVVAATAKGRDIVDTGVAPATRAAGVADEGPSEGQLAAAAVSALTCLLEQHPGLPTPAFAAEQCDGVRELVLASPSEAAGALYAQMLGALSGFGRFAQVRQQYQAILAGPRPLSYGVKVALRALLPHYDQDILPVWQGLAEGLRGHPVKQYDACTEIFSALAKRISPTEIADPYWRAAAPLLQHPENNRSSTIKLLEILNPLIPRLSVEMRAGLQDTVVRAMMRIQQLQDLGGDLLEALEQPQ